MRRFTHIFLICGVSLLFFSACQNRAPSLRMLDSRSGYGSGPDDEEVGLYQRGRQSHESQPSHEVSGSSRSLEAMVRKSAPRVARVYIYPHELPSKDYFWGGYVSVVVTPDEWILDESSLPTIQTVDQPQNEPLEQK